MPTRKASAEIPIKVNTTQAERGLKSLEGSFRATRAVLTRVAVGFAEVARAGAIALGGMAAGGVALAGAIAKISVESVVAQDSLQKMSLRVGVAAEELSRLRHGAEFSGASVQTLDIALTALARRLAAQPALFDKWGISVRGLDGRLASVRTVLDRVADRISRTADQGTRLAIAQDVMSEAGRKLVPFLQAGAEGLKAMGDQVDELGLTISNFEAEAGALLTDRFKILQDQTLKLRVAIGATLAPAIEAFTRVLGESGNVMAEYVVRNREYLALKMSEHFLFMAQTALPAVATSVLVVGEAYHALAQSARATIAIASDVVAAIADKVGLDQAADSYRSLSLSMQDGLLKADGQAKVFRRTIDQMVDVGSKGLRKMAIETRRVFRQLEDLASRSGETGLAESVEGQIRRVQGRIIEGAAGRPESKFKITGKLELPEPDLSPLERMREEFRRTFEDLEIGFAHFSEAFMSSADMLLNATSSMIGGISAAFGETLERAITQGGAALDIMRDVFGSMLISLGRMVFEQGAAAFALGLLGTIPGFQANTPGLVLGPAVMAAGTALMGVGHAFKGGAENPGGGGGAATASPSAGAAAPGAANRDLGGGTVQNITVQVDFRGPVVNPRRTAREVVSAVAGGIGS